MSKVKKLVRKHGTFNTLADKAAANCWRSLQIWQKQNAGMSDKEVLKRIAMRNRDLDGYGRGYAEPTFRRPTACKSGFFKVLLTINENPLSGTPLSLATSTLKQCSMSSTLKAVFKTAFRAC